MFCENCGKELSPGAGVCASRGAGVGGAAGRAQAAVMVRPAEAAEAVPEKAEQPARARKPRKPTARQLMDQGELVGEHILRCADGKYRWAYDLPLLKNPTLFLLVWKIFFFILLGIFAVVIVVDLIDWGDAARLLNNLKFLGYFLIGMTVLVGLGYLLYAATMGWRYSVVFEMDEHGVNHRQQPQQAKKARKLAALTTLAGMASGNLTTMGVGVNAARTEMYTEFSRVRKIKTYPRRHLIKVNERLSHNQVYADGEDFVFVEQFIRDHCENLKNS